MSTYPSTIRARASSRVNHSLAVWAALGVALIGAVVILILAVPGQCLLGLYRRRHFPPRCDRPGPGG